MWDRGDLLLTMQFTEAGLVVVQLGSQPQTLLSKMRFTDGELRGQFAGDIGTEDANRSPARPYRLHCELCRRQNRLTGALIALSTSEHGEGGAPEKRGGSALSHWASLDRIG